MTRRRDDADRRQPEVPANQPPRTWQTCSTAGHEEVDRAKGDHADPTKGAGMHVADCPVSVVAEGELTAWIDIIGPSNVLMP